MLFFITQQEKPARREALGREIDSRLFRRDSFAGQGKRRIKKYEVKTQIRSDSVVSMIGGSCRLSCTAGLTG